MGNSIFEATTPLSVTIIMSQFASQHERYEAMELLQKAGAPAGAVLNVAEVAENEHLERGDTFSLAATQK